MPVHRLQALSIVTGYGGGGASVDPAAHYCPLSEVLLMPLPLQTPRLTLRSPRVEDAEALLAVSGDPEAMRYVGDGRTRNLEELRGAIARGIVLESERGFNMFIVVRRTDGQVLGDCGLSIWGPTGETEIGWRFAKEHCGQGFAQEAAREVLRFAAEEVGLRRLISVIHPENLASRKLAERLGFVVEREDAPLGVPVIYYARDLSSLEHGRW